MVTVGSDLPQIPHDAESNTFGNEPDSSKEGRRRQKKLTIQAFLFWGTGPFENNRNTNTAEFFPAN